MSPIVFTLQVELVDGKDDMEQVVISYTNKLVNVSSANILFAEMECKTKTMST